MKCVIPRPEHPNPQWMRDSFYNLNGEWMFEIDNSASGVERGLPAAHELSGKIVLPFCPESELSGVGERDFMLQVWYKRAVTFNKAELVGKRVIFHIGAADFESEVYVNGTSAGKVHVGGYAPFEYDITSLLIDGENIITVRCYDDTRSPTQPRGKQSEEFYSHNCVYTRTTGIWQTVWYEIVPENYIKYARITPDANNSTVSVLAELVGAGDLTARVFYGGREVGCATKKSLSVIGSLEIPLSETHLWDVGRGELYDVTLEFGFDRVGSYFGLRHIEMRDGKFYLNGRSVFQRLVLDQGYYPDGITTAPSEDALIRDIECSLSAGFNGARLHQKVFEPRFLYHADRLGYLVWGEYGSWGIDYSDIANLPYFLTDWLDTVRRDVSHPCVIGWCPFNETWDYGSDKKRQDNRFLKIIYEETKRLDPSRPCIDTSGNYHVATDIFDVHNYEQNPAVLRADYEKLVTENRLVSRYSDRQCWRGEPIFVSEYGGIGLDLSGGRVGEGDKKVAWSYGTAPKSYEEFYARLRGLTDALLDNPKIFGFCYTQLTDVEQEVNGLFDYKTREPKYDLAVISEIFSRKAALEN